jgi:GT2 family glycosyltransferase
MIKSEFATFIITFNRGEILQNTISQICKQTLLPSKILIVNNGEKLEPKFVSNSVGIEVEEHVMGFNSGPAGAANFAMRALTTQGYKWIQWIDDDDPPKLADLNERLFGHLANLGDAQIGIIAAVGSYFNESKALAIRVGNAEIQGKKYLDVQTVGGNQCMLINTDVVKLECLPTESLFFGFEETNFCLKVIRAGYKIVVPCDLFFEYRNASGRWDLKKKGATKFIILPWRNYYSTRNLVYMYLYEFKRPAVVMTIIATAILKSLFSFFKRGPAWGFKELYYLCRGVKDGFQKRLGLTVRPLSKH